MKLLSPSSITVIGLGIFAIGIGIEIVAEFQRKYFKANLANKGKPYGGGLFSLVTHISYSGSTLWRVGGAMVAARVPWAIALGTWFLYNFATKSIPDLDPYCAERYGEEWERIEKRVGWKLLPGIY